MLAKMRESRNMHVTLTYDTRTAVRRSQAIRKVKHALVLEDYRAVFPQQKDLLFIYKANPESIFLAPYQVSILNLFALLRLN